MTGKAFTADALLLLTAIIWGFAFVAQRAGMDYIGPFLYTGIRFLLGALVLVPFLVAKHRRKPHNHAIKQKHGARLGAGTLAGALAGAVLFLGVSFQQVGLLYTSAGKAGFITGLYVIIVPLLGVLRRQKSRPGTWVGASLAVVGLYFLTVTGGFRIGRGDLLVLISALFWAIHVQIIGWISPKVESLQLAATQFTLCGFAGLIVALISEEIAGRAIIEAALPIAYGGICSVGIAFTLQVVAQKKAPPAHAAIIMSLEGVFAVLGGYLLLNESLSPRGGLGCLLMFGGMVLSQIAVIKAAARTSSGIESESSAKNDLT